jgi:cytochrome c oxidase assembly factor 5
MSSSCSGVKDEIVDCIKRSACMKTELNTFHHCLRAPAEELGLECSNLRHLYYECKRAQLDRRYRLKGNPAFGRANGGGDKSVTEQ